MWEVVVFIVGSVAGYAVFQAGRADRRFAIYDEVRRSFDEEGMYSQIFKALDLMDSDDEAEKNKGREKLAAITPGIRHGFLALLERIALIWRSGLVNIRVLNYNFGYYAILAYDTDEMWPHKDDRSHAYYASLRDFVEQLRKEQRHLTSQPREYIKGVRMSGLSDLFSNPFN